MGFLQGLLGRAGPAAVSPGPAADGDEPAPGPGPAAPAGAAQGRRERVLPEGEQVLVDGLSEKVLHGWLQNRHQTLFPLVVNFRALGADQAAAVAAWMAVAARATRAPAALPRADAAARDWLAGVGADAATLALFDAALREPPPLHRALADVAGTGLVAYAFVAALVATDPHDPATPPFLDYVAARLAVPLGVQRSAARRHRR